MHFKKDKKWIKADIASSSGTGYKFCVFCHQCIWGINTAYVQVSTTLERGFHTYAHGSCLKQVKE